MNDILSSLQGVNTKLIQYYSIAFSIGFLVFIVELVRRRRIREEYSIIWIVFGLVFLFFSIFRGALNFLAYNLGIAYVPMALMLILVMGIFLILVQYSIVITKLTEDNKNIIQENAIVNNEIEALKRDIEILKSKENKNS